jgi:hypothetical protein
MRAKSIAILALISAIGPVSAQTPSVERLSLGNLRITMYGDPARSVFRHLARNLARTCHLDGQLYLIGPQVACAKDGDGKYFCQFGSITKQGKIANDASSFYSCVDPGAE